MTQLLLENERVEPALRDEKIVNRRVASTFDIWSLNVRRSDLSTVETRNQS
jgi:hypothetical protein